MLNFLTFLTLSSVAISCLKRKEGSDTKHHASGGTIAIGHGSTTDVPHVVRKEVNSIFVDSRLDNSSTPLIAGSVIRVSKVVENVYSFPTLQGPRYFGGGYLPQGSVDSPYMSSIGLDFKFTDISGNPSHGYQTPATLPQLIKDANAGNKRFVILYFWSVCQGDKKCAQNTEHLIDLQNNMPHAQVFSIYVDRSKGNRNQTELEVANAVRDWREKRRIAKISFPVLWLQGRNDDGLLDMFGCHDDDGRKSVPCTIFLDRCGIAKQVLPCPAGYNKCLASFVGTALDFREHKLRRNIQNVMASTKSCPY